MLPILIAAPVQAHTVKTAENVAVTFHIEPDHSPKARQPAQAWFVLTQAGGRVIPLEDCDCQLTVYPQPRTAESTPVLTPTLQTIAAEQYKGIPGAEVVFPKPGAYELELSGKPRAAGEFEPFKLSYEVVVQPSVVPPKNMGQTSYGPEMTEQAFSSEEAESSLRLSKPFRSPMIVVLAVSLIVMLRLAARWLDK